MINIFLVLTGVILISYYSVYYYNSYNNCNYEESYISKNRQICSICNMNPCRCRKSGCSSCSRGMIGPY